MVLKSENNKSKEEDVEEAECCEMAMRVVFDNLHSEYFTIEKGLSLPDPHSAESTYTITEVKAGVRTNIVIPTKRVLWYELIALPVGAIKLAEYDHTQLFDGIMKALREERLKREE